ncbi:MAG TPA: hypothetical protein VIK69_04055 [Methylophilaceae bacterium]|jgi:hypothetical protein
MNAKNIKAWGVAANSTVKTPKRTNSTQWIQSSNPQARIQALSAFKAWYFQQYRNNNR